MTKLYDHLNEAPQTGIDRSNLSFPERAHLRQLRIRRSHLPASNSPGAFTTVYYIEGDERAAARKFVEKNRPLLEAIDFSNPDPIQMSVSREVYDWILHELRERKLRKYHTVVYERRPDGLEWVIDRNHFHDHPERRYSASSYTARIASTTTANEIYHDLESPITEGGLANYSAVEGSNRCLWEYYRVAGPFDCKAITVDDQPMLVKFD